MADNVAPEVTTRLRLTELLRAGLGSDADVFFGAPAGEAGKKNVWVGGVEDTEDHHGARGDQGPSVRQRFVAHVHVDVEDDGATAEELTTICWALVGRVRQIVRDAARDRGESFGADVQAPPKVIRTSSPLGPMPLDGGGFAEQVLVDVQFTTKI